MNKRIAIVIVSGLLLSGALTACSADNATSASSGGKVASDQGVPAPAVAANPGTGFGGAGAVRAPSVSETLTPADVQRSIIYNGTITLRVKDVDAAATAAEGIATGSGGYVGGDDREIDASRSTATVTLRVPAASFDATVTSLQALGTEMSRQVSTQDVTSQVIDVQSRLKTQQASVDRIRQLIASTTSIGEIVSLEDELTTRESDLESMEAQLRALTDLTSLSTITVILLGPEAQVAVPPPAKKKGFIAGLHSGWNGFVTSVGVVLTIIGAVLPFAIVIGIPLWIIVVLLRRRRGPAVPALATAQPRLATEPGLATQSGPTATQPGLATEPGAATQSGPTDAQPDEEA